MNPSDDFINVNQGTTGKNRVRVRVSPKRYSKIITPKKNKGQKGKKDKKMPRDDDEEEE